MRKKNLLESNCYLLDSKKCEILLQDAICTSTAIEGVCKAAKVALAGRTPVKKRSATARRSGAASARSSGGKASPSVRSRA